MADPDLLLDRVGGGMSVPLDLSVLLKTRALVQASSGGRKSYLLRYLLERTVGRGPHLVIDPEGEFVSLRERYPYVAVGEGGDVAVRPETAGPLARALVEAGASAVLDLYALRLGERRQFVRGFLEGLLALPRGLWRPALVVIDEAHRFAPERGGGGGREPGRRRDAVHTGPEAGAGGRCSRRSGCRSSTRTPRPSCSTCSWGGRGWTWTVRVAGARAGP